jgi:diguanylate cyclase (GGDEF)-like protein
LKRPPLLRWAALVALTAVLVGGPVWLMHARSEMAMKNHALETGGDWASFLVRSTPELLLVLKGEPLNRATVFAYRQAQELSAVTSFVLYDDAGVPRLAFDGGELQPLPSARPTLPQAQIDSVLGEPVITGQRGDVSSVIAPVTMAGQTIGYVRTVVDQSELRAAYFARTRGVAAGLGVLSVMVLALVGWHTLRVRAQDDGGERPHLDRLTGLPDRASFLAAVEASLQRQLSHDGQVAVLVVDIDKFMEINNHLGNEGGDHALKTLSRRVTDVAAGGMVARLGEDAFAVLLAGPDVEAEAQRIGETIMKTAAFPVEWDGERVHPTVSVGAAIGPADGREAAILLRHADLAHAAAKAMGGNRLNYFNDGLGRQYEERLALDRAIEAACRAESFRLDYQPVVEMKSGRIVGFEALLRLTDDAGQPIPPSAFIPAAERSGAIAAMGLWAIRRACAFAAEWPAPLYVAVNLSPTQFESDDVVAEVAAALEAAQLPAHRLEIEITESVLLNDASHVRDRLDALHRLGVRVVLDDFGAGYSSLSYLWRFPFDKLKIDQSFVRAMNRNAQARGLLRSVVAMGRTLELPVTVEGIESQDEADFMRKLRCDYAQGFLFGKPMPEAEVPGLLLRAFQRDTQPKLVTESEAAPAPMLRRVQ